MSAYNMAVSLPQVFGVLWGDHRRPTDELYGDTPKRDSNPEDTLLLLADAFRNGVLDSMRRAGLEPTLK